MAVTWKMVASEILICGVKAGIKQIPIVGEVAVHVVENLQRRHEAMGNAAQMAEFEAQLSRVERNMRGTVEKEIRTILGKLSRPSLPGPELTREMTELWQIYEQGWVPNLFEGILRNSSHWEELRRNPKQYGRILGNHEPVDPANGLHLLIDKDSTRILELPASSLAFLLSNQSVGIPPAEVRSVQDIWAFPTKTSTRQHVIGTATRILELGGKDYEDRVLQDVERAISADTDALTRLCGNYINNVKGYTQREKVKNKYTGRPEEPDERLMRSIEEKIDIPESRKDDFRREIMNYIGALALDGKRFDYRTNERLQKALELKLFQDQKDTIKLTRLVSSVVDKDTQEKIDIVKARLIRNYGYDEDSATDALNHVASIYTRNDVKRRGN